MKNTLFKICDINFNSEDLLDEDKEEIKFNQEELLGHIIYNRVAGIAYNNLLRIEDKIVSKDIMLCLQNQYKYDIERTKRYLESLKNLSKIFEEVDFKYDFLKGAYLIPQKYEIGYRTSNDYDILVKSTDLDRIDNLLRKNGFIQGYFVGENKVENASRYDILRSRMNYGEVYPYVKIDNGNKVCVDVNFSLDYKPNEEGKIIDEFLNKAVYVNDNDLNYKVLNLCDCIIYLCFHLYKEATVYNWVEARRDLLLYKFSDLNLILTSMLDTSLMENLISQINILGANKECYYSIKNTTHFFGKLAENSFVKNILDSICPKNLKFMNEIYNPQNGKTYIYDEDIINWFYRKNKISCLHEIEV